MKPHNGSQLNAKSATYGKNHLDPQGKMFLDVIPASASKKDITFYLHTT
jgi:hypothetical protein